MELCDPCGTRLLAHQDAAHSIGESVDMSMLVAILCSSCFSGVQQEDPMEETSAVDVPAEAPESEPVRFGVYL